jgi:hypothetical protein
MGIKSILILVVGLIAGGVVFTTSPAAASVGIGVTPSLIKLAAEPGTSGSQNLTVSNEGDQPVEVTVTVNTLADAAPENSAVDWMTVTPSSLQLEPGQKQEIAVSIEVPDGLASGGYYASVTLTTGSSSNESATGIAAQLGVPFLFTIDGTGDLEESAEIERFEPIFEADGRVGFAAQLRSTGNVYIEAQGQIEIADVNGKHVASLELPQSPRILPGSALLLSTQGSVPLEIGQTYTATATLTYGASQTALTSSQTFTVGEPAVTAVQLSVCENLDTGPTLSLGLQNEGQLGAQPGVALEIRTADGENLGQAALPGQVIAWPGETGHYTVVFPERLESGNYSFSVTTQLGQEQPVTTELPFQIGGVEGTPVPLCSSTSVPASTPAA